MVRTLKSQRAENPFLSVMSLAASFGSPVAASGLHKLGIDMQEF
jgi:hypothetical protein